MDHDSNANKSGSSERRDATDRCNPITNDHDDQSSSTSNKSRCPTIDDDCNSNTFDDANIKRQQQQQTSSSPIDIKQAASGKFGVFHARQSPDPSSAGLMTDQNGEPVSIDKIIKTANTMSSMMMAHKIALEDDFRLEPGMDITGPLMSLSPIIGSSPVVSSSAGGQQAREGPSLQTRVKDIVHEAYWDVFREELESHSAEDKDERRFDISKQLICDIKQKIHELLLPQHGRLKQDIEDRLDMQIIEQLIKVDSFDLVEYAKFILSVMAKLCAPIRDEKLKELSETTNVVQLYRGIMEMLELMRLDFANFTLNHFKPHIKAHSQDYEREKFNEILKQQKTIGIDGLEYTKIWLDRAVKRVDSVHGIADIINNDHDNVSELSNMVAEEKSDYTIEEKILRSDIVSRVLNTAYCELLEWSSNLQKLYPETLIFDEATFKQLGEQYKILLLTSSILLTTFAFLNRFKLQDMDKFKILIKSHVITLLTASYDATTTTTNNNRPLPADQATRPTSIDTKPSTTHSEDTTIDQIKLESVSVKLCDDIRQKITETDKGALETFSSQMDLFKRQILDLQVSSNRVRELARRRILEFVETLLVLDVKHQQRQFSTRMPPPVSIPLGLNCLADEITLTMAQLVKIIRYNRRVFFHHYQDIIVELVSKHV